DQRLIRSKGESAMASRSLTPFSRNTQMSRWSADTDPFMAMRHEMNRLFENAFGGFGLPTLFGSASGGMPAQSLAPQMDVSETEREIHVTAELPGIDPKDIEVMLADDRLIIDRKSVVSVMRYDIG